MTKIKKLADRIESKMIQNDIEETIPQGSRTAAIVQAKDSLEYGEETFTKDVQRYKIIGVKNPFHFYMVKETSENEEVFTRLKIFKYLQELMMEKKVHLQTVVKHLEKFRIYLAFHQSTNQWHRVRLLQSYKKTVTVLVYFVDYPLLELAHVHMDSLRELPDLVTEYPVVPVYKAHLHDVIPTDGGYKWKAEVVEWFEKQAKKGSVWVGLQMTWKAKRVDNGPDQSINVGVVLFEDNDNPDRSRSLNFRLVRCGYGKAIGIGATHSSNIFLPEWEPVFSLENVPASPYTDRCLGKLPVFVGNRWPQVAIRTVHGPNCIYVFLKSKYKEYRAMKLEIEKIFKSGLPKVDNSHVKIGLGCLVVFKNLRTQRFDIHRSVVIRVNGPKTVEVIFVDVGEIFTVPVSTLYALPRRVKQIPAFVHRLHLKSVAPPPNPHLLFLRWFGKIDAEFNRLIMEIGLGSRGGEDKTAWFAMRSDIPTFDQVIALRNVCEDLVFNKALKTWEAMSSSSSNLHHFERQTMMKNHLLSFGVDLLFIREKRGSEKKDELKWDFESLAETVVADKERFEAELVGDKMDKKRYYDGLLRHTEGMLG